MAVLVDDARWPAHGRLWAHLVSDASLAELHAFARAAGVPARSFDADHYDVPDVLVPALVAAGAEQVGGRELTRRLRASGLRVSQRAKREGARRQPPDWPDPAGTTAVLLAAGAGTRFGGPKALARDDDGEPWLVQRVRALRDGGCDRVLVVLGAQAGSARQLVPPGADVVVAQDWADGMSASLRAGLAALAAAEPPVAAALVALVDTPGLRPDVVRRVLGAVPTPRPTPSALARATYGGRPGHPVLLGRAHWSAAAAAARGDRGAGPYLRDAGARLVECGDLDGGEDVDARPTLAP
ncbi:DUF4031 domain-containing protein [Quadrisphaera setariae]|uniref:DUF4031 domain-containing protein n=1 Tax=Quadrisphaera setariae TaxID=2593304 RepID=A0A5C8Z2F5_9ACTN|nr:DUF4031 domain-containing protein [Quadrisphaera setariae]TXR52275.1 DUF4031 domain-containing protein [Quadrisphaera setariae]